MVLEKSSYLREWKEDMRERIRLQYSEDEISDKEIEKYLDKQIEKHINDRKVIIVNNYNNRVSRTTILELIELIRNNNLIVGGAGCLFLPHGQKRNLLIEFIDYIKTGRSLAKKKRKQFPKGSVEWAEADREQLAFKLIINSLYGCLGYPGFIMFNIFLAEAITNEGRNIICSAINAVENFVGDSMFFENDDEVSHVIVTIHKEYMKIFNGKEMDEKAMSFFGHDIDFESLPDLCVQRYLNHCLFIPEKSFIENLRTVFHNIGRTELLMMYFKNNWVEFSRLSFMKVKNRSLIETNGEPLMFCEDKSYANESAVSILKENWGFYETFVLYDHPIFDRMRKAMYIDKSRSLYTDTDSVFISLDEFMKYLTNEVFDGPSDVGMDRYEMQFTTANVSLSYINRMIDHAMQTLCRSQAVTPEYAKILNMKNEFYFSRIMFCDVKKRYISNALLQEGQKLFDPEKFSSFEEALAAGQPGLPEIKGKWSPTIIMVLYVNCFESLRAV